VKLLTVPAPILFCSAIVSRGKPKIHSRITFLRVFPQILKGAGYDTALVGKWHIGTLDTISAAGFDYVVSKASGITNSMYNTSIFDNGKSYKVYEPISDFWTQKASDYIANQSTAAKPFFLTLSLSGPYWGPLPNLGPDTKDNSLQGMVKLSLLGWIVSLYSFCFFSIQETLPEIIPSISD
jgi:Sulfatase